MTTQLTVSWWDGSTIGYIVNRGTNFFGYEPTWIERGHNLSPLKLPFTAAAFNCSKGVESLPGFLADCLPDAWGRRVARISFAEQKLGPLTPINLLAWRGSRGLGALRFEPVLGNDGKPTSGKIAAITAASLARGAAAIQRGTHSEVLPQLVRGGTAGGAFPKALVLAYPDNTIAVGEPDGAGVPSLLKFDLSELGGEAECEHAYSLMSAAAGINCTTTTLIADDSRPGRHHLLVKRFDVAPDQPTCRVHFHSLARILHHDVDRAVEPLDYGHLFRAAAQLHVPPSDLREITRRMIFNVLAANPDDHGKNHAFQYDETRRKWAVTPAYDVSFHPGMTDRGLRVNGEVWPRLDLMQAMSRDVGISKDEFATIVEQVESAIVQWPRFAKQANVPDRVIQEAAGWHTRIRQALE